MINKYNNITKSHTISNLNKFIGENNKKLNIVLDLDNTIIYTIIFDSKDISKIKYYEIFKNNNLLGKFVIMQKTYLVYIRPYFTYFLNTIKIYFNLYIYTNSQEIYCKNVINLLRNKYLYFEIKKIISRNNNYSLIKQLSLICDNIDDLHFMTNNLNYNEFVNKTIIIDDNIDIWKFDKENLINVNSFNESTNKTNLYKDEILDDTLLILANRIFIIYNLFFLDSNNDIKKLISKYKLYNN
jgi:TFIIF-interacting CTD phosphatase-like protein